MYKVVMADLLVRVANLQLQKMRGITTRMAYTGVMAMLCCHDCVLWLTNMTLAGEKQHYALALIKKLFNNLLPDMTIGLLYDIGSQLHHSCLKYRLLDDTSFMLMATNEPVKSYTILANVKALAFQMEKNLILFGNWLSWRWNNCVKKKSNAMQALCELSVDETYVHQEWKSQVEYQMKPLPRRLKASNDEEISKILSLEKSLVVIDGSLQGMEMQLCDDEVILYYLDCHAQQFIDLVLGWQMKVCPIPSAWPMPDCWGLSHAELANRARMMYPDVHGDEDDVWEDGDDWELDIGCGDEELMDVLEDIALADQYRGREVHDIEGDYVINDSVINSPTKHVRYSL
ncbi:hypothetical protein F4604DRAFT_1691496 [Suillus subluteus]|nr:hypothetical protein F4604DRAFT_1691496 [Suillus subluteus]